MHIIEYHVETRKKKEKVPIKKKNSMWKKSEKTRYISFSSHLAGVDAQDDAGVPPSPPPAMLQSIMSCSMASSSSISMLTKERVRSCQARQSFPHKFFASKYLLERIECRVLRRFIL